MPFQRDLPPLWYQRIGKPKEILDWLDYNIGTSYKIKSNDSTDRDVIIIFNGNVVIDDFDIAEAEGIKGNFKLKIISLDGSVTILDQLSKDALYLRIREQYNNILKNCLGKSVEDQEEFLGLKNRRPGLNPDTINNSSNYVKNIPISATNDQIKDLILQILSGILEYAFHFSDQNSVEIHQYARALARKIGYTPFKNL